MQLQNDFLGTGGVAQLVEGLTSMHTVLGSVHKLNREEHAYPPSTQEVETEGSEYRVILSYTVSLRPA